MSFPGISRVLKRIRGAGEDADFLRTPKKENQSRKPNAKENKTKKIKQNNNNKKGAIGVRKPGLSYSNGVASGEKQIKLKKKNQRWENTGRGWEAEEGFPAPPRRGRAAGAPGPARAPLPGLPRSGTPAPPGDGGGRRGAGGGEGGGVEMNSVLSQNTLSRRERGERGGRIKY